MIITKVHEKINNLRKEQESALIERYNVLLNNAKKSKNTLISIHPQISIFMIIFALFASFGIAIGLMKFVNYDIFSSFIIYLSVLCGPMCLTGILVSMIKVKNKKAIKFISENKKRFMDSYFDDEVASLELLKEYKEYYGSEKLKALLYENNNEEITIGDLKRKVNTTKYIEEYQKIKKTNEIVEHL